MGRLRGATLGRWPHLSQAAAREKALEFQQEIAAGLDPVERRLQKRAKAYEDANLTLAKFSERWVVEVVRKVRKDPHQVELTLGRDVLPALGHRQIRWITGEEVQQLIFAKRDAGYPAAAVVLRHLLKRMFEYAQVCGAIDRNPTELTPRKFVARLRSRARFLSADELRVILPQLRGGSLDLRMGLTIRLMILTLCRKSELRLARWDQIQMEGEDDARGLMRGRLWELPAESSKMGHPHIFYLSRQAIEMLAKLKAMAGRAEVVLPSRESLTQPIGPAELNKAMMKHRWGVAHFTPHDLRRTASTHLNELGYDGDVIEVALNHLRTGTRGVYNRAMYATERRKMLQEWADWLDELEGA